MTNTEHLSSSLHSSFPQLVVVVGAGISGLCAAYFLKKRGFQVTVLEQDNSVGGTMKTGHEDGWLFERGPNSALENTPLFKNLFDELGITDQCIYANEAANKRYILREGHLHSLSTSLVSFLRSKLLSFSGKARLLKEPIVGRATKEESIAEFIERRLGREFLDYIVNPFVAGVYAGNPETLSVQAALPKLYALEEQYGGIIKGSIKARKMNKPNTRAKLFSFMEGMEIFPRALAKALGENLMLNATVEHIIPLRVGPRSIYTVSYSHSGDRRSMEADAVVLAVPAYAAAKIIHRIDPAMAKTLTSIYYPPVAEVFIGFKKAQIQRPHDGFGFLVPAKEKRKILGTIWSSSMFPNRAPQGYAALTTFVGGARQAELCSAGDEELTMIVLSELQSIMAIEGDPAFTKITRWTQAIPQYSLGYYKIVQAMERFEQNFRGTFLCSNYRGGVSIGDCIMNAEKIAQKISMHLS